MPSQQKIAIVVSTPMTVRVFLLHQIKALAQIYDVTILANLDGQTNTSEWLPDQVRAIHIPIERKPNPINDIKAFFSLISFFYREQFCLVHSVTPKAGLLTMAATWITRVPVRLHTYTGQIWATKHGINRTALRFIDKLINALATKTLVDSHSQREYLLQHGVVTPDSSTVLGDGSISGVDTDRFKSDSTARKEVRKNLGIAESTFLILFLGRLNKEKGVIELAEAFKKIHEYCHNTALCFVGPDEDQIIPKLEQGGAIHFVPFTTIPEHYMAAADIFCLPSYREGFGSVVIEAGACGVPAIGSNIYGLSDAIVDGVTGILVATKSVPDLRRAIQLLIDDPPRRMNMGKAARIYAVEKYSQKQLTEQLLALYDKLI